MATNTLNTRIVLCSKDSTTWASNTTVALKGEAMLEWTSTDYTVPPKIKIGDGVHKFSELPYATLTESEIRSIVNQAAYNLSPATATVLGGVMVGSNIDVDSSGKISVKDGSTSQKGVVQLSDAINSNSSATAASSKAVKAAYDRGSKGVTDAATAKAAADAAQTTADQKVGSVTLASGTNNGTIKLTVDGTDTDNIAVTGLKSAAYTEASAFATAAQGKKADNAMPKSGGTFTGDVFVSGDPTANNQIANKSYVDSQISSKIAANDSMKFMGTLGTGGTVTALPTSNVEKGHTYKVIVAGTYAGQAAKIGDMFIAIQEPSPAASSAGWAYIPSGDEIVTTVKYSTTTQNLTTSAQSGAITVGEAATKQVDTTISAGSTSTKLPTSQAVASFVEGKGYKTTDEHVKQTASTDNGAYPLLASENKSPTSGNAAKAIYNTGITINPSAKSIKATTFEGKLSGKADSAGTADKATALASSVNVSATGLASGDTTTFNGSSALNVNIKTFDVAGLTQQANHYLILDGNFS